MPGDVLPWNVWLFAGLSIAFAAAAQLLMKVGMTTLRLAGRLDSVSTENFLAIALQPTVMFGLVSYGLSAVFWLLVLSRMPLSMAYPLNSLGILTVVILSAVALGENVSLGRAAGVGLIVAGVALIGFFR